MLADQRLRHPLQFLAVTLAATFGHVTCAQAEEYAGSTERVVSLPTDRDTPPADEMWERQMAFSRLLRPRISLAGEWEPSTDGIEISDVDVKLTLPTYPIYGPPPPLLSSAFSYTSLAAPEWLEIPSSLYDFSLGASWMRPINARWMLRLMASAAFASDLNNTSSDAWQFRGGLFATYQWTRDLQLLVGAFASGRDDIPVLPGLGAIWTPTPFWRVDLMMPRPRVSYMLAHDGLRQHWIFLGGGLSGGTWAFENNGRDDKLTYREWRVGAGWESGPPRESVMLGAGGTKWEAELGYVFGRRFEFERRPDELSFDGTLLLRLGVTF